MQDFAGSTAVHLIGATGALAVLLHLGPRRGKYGARRQAAGDPRPQHAAVRPGILILWLGWFGFNPGSTLERARRPLHRGRRSSPSSRPAPACSRAIATRALHDEDDRHRHGRQRRDRRARRHHGAVRLRRRRGPRVVIGAVAGVHRRRSACSRSTRSSTTRSARSAPTAWPASGARWRAACSPTRPGRVQRASVTAGLVYTRLVPPARRPGARRGRSCSRSCSSLSYVVFGVIKATYGLRVSAEEEDAGLDISEHGMYGYPEQFIPAPELVGYGAAPRRRARRVEPSLDHQEVPA